VCSCDALTRIDSKIITPNHPLSSPTTLPHNSQLLCKISHSVYFHSFLNFAKNCLSHFFSDTCGESSTFIKNLLSILLFLLWLIHCLQSCSKPHKHSLKPTKTSTKSDWADDSEFWKNTKKRDVPHGIKSGIQSLKDAGCTRDGGKRRCLWRGFPFSSRRKRDFKKWRGSVSKSNWQSWVRNREQRRLQNLREFEQRRELREISCWRCALCIGRQRMVF